MSIVRIGIGENRSFAEGYDAIFGKKKSAKPKKGTAAAKASTPKKPRKAKKK